MFIGCYLNRWKLTDQGNRNTVCESMMIAAITAPMMSAFFTASLLCPDLKEPSAATAITFVPSSPECQQVQAPEPRAPRVAGRSRHVPLRRRDCECERSRQLARSQKSHRAHPAR